MAAPQRRPLPTPPSPYPRYEDIQDVDAPYMSGLPGLFPYYSSPFSFPYTPFSPATPENNEPPTSTLRGGTLLHRGFYDLLALIPSTPSPSRFLWGGATQDREPVAGPRYEDIPPESIPPQKPLPPSPPPVTSPATRNLKSRRISKDMVSKPTGFMCVLPSHLAKECPLMYTAA